jgi:poly(3-hydroxybutyrate) depolymerase
VQGAQTSANPFPVNVTVDGTPRELLLQVPEPYDPNTPLALTFMFHGAGATDQDAVSFFGIQNAPGASTASIFVFPQGIDDQGFHNVWHDFCVGYDTDFFDLMVQQIESQYCIDTSRVFAGGFSWGCDFSVTLASCRGNVIRAIALASCTDEFANNNDFTTYNNLPSPAPTNAAIRYTHQTLGDPAYPAPDFATTTKLIQSFNQCATSSTSVSPSPCVSYDSCAQPFVECAYDGIGHNIPPNWGNDTWTFFSGF